MLFKYRISWLPDDEQVSEMLLSRGEAIRNFKISLEQNNGRLFERYEIAEDSINIDCK